MPNEIETAAGPGRPSRPSRRAGRRPRRERLAPPVAAAGPDFAGGATAEAAALVLMMAGAAEGDRAIEALAGRLAAGTERRLLETALDEAAWRIARLIDLCLAARPPRPAADRA